MRQIMMIVLFSVLLLSPVNCTPIPQTPSVPFPTGGIFDGNLLNQNLAILSQPNGLTNYSRLLSQSITNAIVQRITSFNNQLFSAAGTIPRMFPPNNAGLGAGLAVPIQLGTIVSNLLAPGIIRNLVSRPITRLSNEMNNLINNILRPEIQNLQNSQIRFSN